MINEEQLIVASKDKHTSQSSLELFSQAVIPSSSAMTEWLANEFDLLATSEQECVTEYNSQTLTIEDAEKVEEYRHRIVKFKRELNSEI